MGAAVRRGERTRGVSTLRAQSRCAFRGFAETRLRAEPLERPVPGFNERERGELVHDSLERVWSELRDSRRLGPDPDAAGGACTSPLGEHSPRIDKLRARRDPGRALARTGAGALDEAASPWLDLESAREPFEVERLEEGARPHGTQDSNFRCASIASIGWPTGARS